MNDDDGRPTTMPDYILGTHDNELERLGFQHRLWSRSASDVWERAGFAPGQTVLDVGCGPGYATFDLAQLVGPAGRVIAIDSSERFVDALRAQAEARRLRHVEARVGDIQELALEPGSIDRAYARWVLCFVERPEAVITGLSQVLRSGGALVVQDYYWYTGIELSPHSDAFRRVVRAVDRSWRLRGGDPEIGKRLPALMAEQGFDLRDIRPLVRVARPQTALWQWPATFFINYLPTLEEMQLITADDRAEFEADWRARSRDPNAFFTTPPMVDVIGVKR